MSERGTGLTSRQMQDALHGALYIWPVANSISYPRSLARHLGRSDLNIRTPAFLDDTMSLRHLNPPDIVIDHACDLNAEQYEVLFMWQDYLNRKDGRWGGYDAAS